MAYTTYKVVYLPTVGGDTGTWGTLLNTGTITSIDICLGGTATRTLTSGIETLNTAENQAPILRLTGTLTGDVNIYADCRGFKFIENLTTGNYYVDIHNGGIFTAVPQGKRTAFIFDNTNGPRRLSEEFASGTVMLFGQTSAPTGWTKSTSHNNKALRVVSGTVSSGGSLSFTSCFGARTIAANNLPVNSPWSLNDPGHSHTYTKYYAKAGGNYLELSNFWYTDTTANTSSETTGITINTNSGGGQSMDFAVQYVDVIFATKG